jgi:hypothetical protein
MKTLVRAAFVLVILLGLASQVIRPGRGDDDRDTMGALVGRLEHQGVQIEGFPTPQTLIGRSPRCEQPFLVALLAIDGTDDNAIASSASPEIVQRYVYLGAVAPAPSRAALTLRWAWATWRFNIGLRQDKPPHRLAMLALPRACADLTTADWSVLSP